MAFSFTMLKKYTKEGGLVVEEGTWTSNGGTTTGNITVNTTIQPEIIKINDADVSSNGDTAVIKAYDVNDTTLKLTFTGNDSGTYKIEGRAA